MKIAFLGDSITYGYGLCDKKDRYTTLVANALGAEEINLGITGTLVARAGMNREDAKSFLDRLPLIKGADVAVIFGGTNDYFWSDRPIFPPEGDTGEDYFYTAADTICRACRERYGDIRVGIVTPYPHHGVGNYKDGPSHTASSEHDTGEKNFNGHVLEDYVKTWVALGAKYDIPVLNLFEDNTFLWQRHTSDGCHPNPEGHRVLAESILTFLRQKLAL